MTTPTLTGIPVELLLEIAKHLSDSPAALSALSGTNVHFYNDLSLSLYTCTAGITSELKIWPAYYTPKEKPIPHIDIHPTTVTPLHRCAFMGNTSAVEEFLKISRDHLNTYSTPHSAADSWKEVAVTPTFLVTFVQSRH
jgi:hypothetical protein